MKRSSVSGSNEDLLSDLPSNGDPTSCCFQDQRIASARQLDQLTFKQTQRFQTRSAVFGQVQTNDFGTVGPATVQGEFSDQVITCK
ncbi:hypothetical protein RB7128 [Rhodopirellula baltica SH 1]|uniref:Uncharacterized protein n=1 Tax=Rhodopirellula baltica (strain DSM 10527 / NCIMB 13988 / SH1) TaxID=243090 RepID=Q7UP67_RHOBA|nr:hypothetical protein RB7128 [Rhodopirellula baltica SH 1]